MADTELLPCPWCGETPDVSNDASFRLTDGMKYGALQCCVVGPEVRTDYKDVPHWREAAIAAWNDRKALASRPAEVDDWIRVDDERKPVLGEVVLLYVRTLTCGYIDDIPREGEGAEIAMGEYRMGDESEYFNCYTSPISDYDWITHWRKMPAAPSHTTNKEK